MSKEDKGFVEEVAAELAKEGRTWLRWARTGALIGGVAGGAAGLYFGGWTGMVYGAGMSAMVCAVAAWLLYLSLSAAGWN